jgi:hypothetical protein
MADLPDAMRQHGRSPDQHFDPAERLFRRFRPVDLEGTTVAVDAIELPDMSVNREKYGPPDWLLLDEAFETWGVAAFRVHDVPAEITHLGVIQYTFGVEHQPLRNNYPHSEVRAYRDGDHIDLKHKADLDPESHLRWRERLQWKIRVAIQPKRNAE